MHGTCQGHAKRELAKEKKWLTGMLCPWSMRTRKGDKRCKKRRERQWIAWDGSGSLGTDHLGPSSQINSGFYYYLNPLGLRVRHWSPHRSRENQYYFYFSIRYFIYILNFTYRKLKPSQNSRKLNRKACVRIFASIDRVLPIYSNLINRQSD